MILAHRRAKIEYYRSPRFAGYVVVGLLIAGAAVVAVESMSFASEAAPQGDQAAAAAAALAGPDPFDGIDLLAKGVYVLDLTSGKVLYEKNPNVQLALASVTKVPLAIAVSEVLSPDAAIKIPFDTSPPGSAEHLGEGQIWRIKDILNFTLIASSNNGADILAQTADPLVHNKYPGSPVSGATIWRMNDLARELGLHNTFFINDNGLDESTTQAGSYGSARDMAILFAYAIHTWPSTFAGTTQNGMLLTSVHGDTTSAYNTNDALGSIPGLIMGKTGYTDLAGGNLGIVFNVGLAHPVVAIVLDSTYDGRFTDMKKIIAASYEAVARE